MIILHAMVDAMRALGLVVVAAVGVAMAGCNLDVSVSSAGLNKVTASGVDIATVGIVAVSETNGKFEIQINVEKAAGLAAGDHGVHIHVNPSCEPGPASATDATVVAAGKAGGHFNPANAKHGSHAGDLGNIKIASDGTGSLTVTSFKAALNMKENDPLSVRGHSLVVHAARDDGTTDPSGNSGARVLCGIMPS